MNGDLIGYIYIHVYIYICIYIYMVILIRTPWDAIGYHSFSENGRGDLEWFLKLTEISAFSPQQTDPRRTAARPNDSAGRLVVTWCFFPGGKVRFLMVSMTLSLRPQ